MGVEPGTSVRIIHQVRVGRWRKLVEITRNGPAPVAQEGVRRIGELQYRRANHSADSPQSKERALRGPRCWG